ncbi:pre-mRNA-processing factor 39 isoform X2 [Galleria mellonella]|uniref:Pre-mRNA-processing factor 39 isoform X2 n=1 Tax=Galleria mellonella TaxID=7137 RepID=A0ABM3MYB3_GALME|nr:pre-mRNA-processing factor 39 isoform X2 [Galleria mellonella]
MDDESSSDLHKCLSEGPMDTDEGPLINENSNGLSHLLTEGEFNSVDAVVVDESSASNQGFLNAVELSAGSVGDYLDQNTEGFNTHSFDVGDNAVTFPSESLTVLSDSDSLLYDNVYKVASDTDGDVTESQKAKMDTDYELQNASETSNVDFPSIMETNAARSGDTIEVTAKEAAKQLCDSNTIDKAPDVDDKIVGLQINKADTAAQLKEKNTSLSAEESASKIAEKTVPTSQRESVPIVQESARKPLERNALLDAENSTSLAAKKSVKITEQSVKLDKVPSAQPPDESSMEDSELLKRDDKVGGAEETEVVSEDELPTVEKPSVKDAENVSDDELPGPKPAELPADTEVVSEDELPASKKDSKESRKRKPDEERDGYDPGSPTSESESASKKQAIAKNGESKPIPAEKRSSIDEKPKKKTLPELDKYWKVVNDDPTDFTGWTYLLQYVDQESDVEAAREAYDAFLSHYPYCYGYWRKYADYEKRKGSKKKCLEVLERGLKAIPLSVDLWIHYLNHIKATRTDDHSFIRSQYERAIDACGLEFRSDRLWESYIKWEAENGPALNVTNIYDRLLATPTLGYTSHFDNFQEHVMSEPVTGAVSSAELVRLRADVRHAAPAQPQLDLPPGEDEPLDHIASEEEAQAIKERIIAARRKVHKATGEQVAARWSFEEGIKRPYFHVKPLERCQLKNWKAYLEWEKQHGSLKRALVLHERCLIACALYEEFWMRLIKFLEERIESNPELVSVEREVLERACTVHHLDKPELHLHWAHFEEAHGNPAKAAEILDRIEKTCPNLVQIQYRRVNLERRRGDYEKCSQLYEGYIAAAKSKAVASALSIKYARFLYHVKRDAAAAAKALDEAITKDPLNHRLHMQRLDVALHTPGTPYEVLEELVQAYERQEGAEAEVSASLAWRRRELAEELGPAAAARAAAAHARALAKHLRKRARKDKHEPPPLPSAATEPSKKKESSAATTSATTPSSNSYYQTSAATAQSYDQSYAQPYQPPWGYQQAPGPYQHHPHPWPQYPNYY